MPYISHIIKDELSQPLRLDRYLSETLKLLSRSQIKVRNLNAKVNGKEVKISRLVKSQDHLEISWDNPSPVDLVPQDIPLEILWEDEKCIVVNKQQGMVVHPGAGNHQGTLANALCYNRLQKGSAFPSSQRPGIVHRLDKDTSGLIICAWDEESHRMLSEQFKNRKVKKYYLAIVCGMPNEIKGCIETFIARDVKDRKKFTVSSKGKYAISFYKVLKQWQSHSLILLRPKTGRTHQLRVHMRHIGCPILGDSIYGNKDSLFPNVTLMLHSKRLVITLPQETEQRVFTSIMPQRFFAIMEKLNKIEGKHE
ncbi:MAG: RluA family pseudouridine synthase [Treponema sp.]|jgi:23S rRNA pseudouridine1911/1915/1917 synthase|nr:RluA family pseudouridine synthase [Treponema sp.]